MLLPYKVKNPAKKFPVATLSIIALNVLVYAFTTDGLTIRQDAVEVYASALGRTPWYTVFTAMFLHLDIFHIGGNMLFLWVFGPSVEDRLGVSRYLGVYFATGFAGDILQALLDVAFGGLVRGGIGASGCVMGILGAYWYIFPWSTVCVIYFFWIIKIWAGIWDVAALWVIGGYILLNLAGGLLGGAMGAVGGVASFCHVGGGVAGALLCLAMRVKRDTEALSEAKAVQADMKDLTIVPLDALETMLENDPGNPEIIRAMFKPALSLGRQNVLDQAVSRAGPAMIDKDPAFVAHYLTTFPHSMSLYQPMHVLRLAGAIERGGDPSKALRLYQMIVEGCPTSRDAEAALYRMACCYWSRFRDSENARACLRKMATQFPNGEMTPYGRTLWNQMAQSPGH